MKYCQEDRLEIDKMAKVSDLYETKKKGYKILFENTCRDGKIWEKWVRMGR